MLVSVITVTYNRSRFIPELIKCYDQQLWPEKEWLILDDSEPDEQVLNERLLASHPTARYIHQSNRSPMGQKLNYLASLCRGDIIVIMDDDDYYPPTRISSAVEAFQANPTLNIAGCSKVYMHFLDEDAVYVAGPYHDSHALHCTMAYRSSYLANHSYDDKETCAVERVFTNNFTEPMIQLDPKQTILHRVHASNTFQQKRSVGRLRKTSYRPDGFMKVE
jgi:glycosyltransferase involved in cell wall biosynthesis